MITPYALAINREFGICHQEAPAAAEAEEASAAQAAARI